MKNKPSTKFGMEQSDVRKLSYVDAKEEQAWRGTIWERFGGSENLCGYVHEYSLGKWHTSARDRLASWKIINHGISKTAGTIKLKEGQTVAGEWDKSD
jgi:hypothetical protein